jgi:hypothetical protein
MSVKSRVPVKQLVFQSDLVKSIPNGKYYYGETNSLDYILWFTGGVITDIRFVEYDTDGNPQSYPPWKNLTETFKECCLFNILGGRCEFDIPSVDLFAKNPLYKFVYVSNESKPPN